MRGGGLTRAPFQRSELADDGLSAAEALLGAVLVHGGTAGRIVEVEAYHGAADPASHAYRGPTARNAVMFGPAGHLYVYLIYGMHHCANVVAGPEGEAQAVLVRALEPLKGIEEMTARRAGTARDLCRGPGRLCEAMAIDRTHDGADLCGRGLLRLEQGEPPRRIGRGPRVGVTSAAERPWRLFDADSPHVSPYRRATARARS